MLNESFSNVSAVGLFKSWLTLVLDKTTEGLERGVVVDTLIKHKVKFARNDVHSHTFVSHEDVVRNVSLYHVVDNYSSSVG